MKNVSASGSATSRSPLSPTHAPERHHLGLAGVLGQPRRAGVNRGAEPQHLRRQAVRARRLEQPRDLPGADEPAPRRREQAACRSAGQTTPAGRGDRTPGTPGRRHARRPPAASSPPPTHRSTPTAPASAPPRAPSPARGSTRAPAARTAARPATPSRPAAHATPAARQYPPQAGDLPPGPPPSTSSNPPAVPPGLSPRRASRSSRLRSRRRAPAGHGRRSTATSARPRSVPARTRAKLWSGSGSSARCASGSLLGRAKRSSARTTHPPSPPPSSGLVGSGPRCGPVPGRSCRAPSEPRAAPGPARRVSSASGPRCRCRAARAPRSRAGQTSRRRVAAHARAARRTATHHPCSARTSRAQARQAARAGQAHDESRRHEP